MRQASHRASRTAVTVQPVALVGAVAPPVMRLVIGTIEAVVVEAVVVEAILDEAIPRMDVMSVNTGHMGSAIPPGAIHV